MVVPEYSFGSWDKTNDTAIIVKLYKAICFRLTALDILCNKTKIFKE